MKRQPCLHSGQVAKNKNNKETEILLAMPERA